MRILGLFIIAIATLFELLAVMFIVIAITQQGAVGWITAAAVFGVIGTVAMLVGIGVFRKGKPIRGADSTTDPPGTVVGRYVASVPSERELDSAKYTLLYTPPTKGKNKRPSSLRVTTKVDVDGEFEIVPESSFDRFGKRWGLAVEIHTGDETFDERCFVRTDTVPFAEAYLNNPDNRAIIADLHSKGFKSVALHRGEIHATWIGFDPLTNDTPDLGEEIGARLILLSRKLPPDLPEADWSPGRRRKTWTVILWITLILFAGMILALIGHPPVHESDLLLRAMPVLVLGLPLFLFIAGLVVRGTSRSHYSWSGLLIAGFLFFPVGSIGSVSLLNTVLDRSKDTVHEVRIIRKYTSRSKNTTNYHIECESWRDPAGTESFKVGSGEYGTVVEGQSRYVVTTRDGGLGIEWIASRHMGVGPKKR